MILDLLHPGNGCWIGNTRATYHTSPFQSLALLRKIMLALLCSQVDSRSPVALSFIVARIVAAEMSTRSHNQLPQEQETHTEPLAYLQNFAFDNHTGARFRGP